MFSYTNFMSVAGVGGGGYKPVFDVRCGIYVKVGQCVPTINIKYVPE